MGPLGMKVLRALLRGVEALEALGRTLQRRWALVGALLVAAIAAVASQSCGHALTVATFNIRRFGVEETDLARLDAQIEALSADLIAVQEIQRPDRLDELAARLRAHGRPYRTVTSSCAGRRAMHVGFLYDERHLQLKEVREFRELLPDEGACTDGDRPGLLGVFTDPRGEPVHALVVHLKAGDADSDFGQRQRQWQRLSALLDGLRAGGARRLILLGDMNSTGYLTNRRGERDLIESLAQREGLRVATARLGCTEYYQGEQKRMLPSLLDHALVTGDALVDGSVTVHAHCAELSCTPQDPGAMPPSYTTVSDHCPVTFRLAR